MRSRDELYEESCLVAGADERPRISPSHSTLAPSRQFISSFPSRFFLSPYYPSLVSPRHTDMGFSTVDDWYLFGYGYVWIPSLLHAG